MAKTTAQRQSDYRAKRAMAGTSGERRLTAWVTTGTHLALGRIAQRYGITQREVLENLLRAEDDKILATIEYGTAEWNKYLGG